MYRALDAGLGRWPDAAAADRRVRARTWCCGPRRSPPVSASPSGPDGSVSPQGVDYGALPVFPPLAALPPEGEPGVWAFVALLAPLLGGYAIGAVAAPAARRQSAASSTSPARAGAGGALGGARARRALAWLSCRFGGQRRAGRARPGRVAGRAGRRLSRWRSWLRSWPGSCTVAAGRRRPRLIDLRDRVARAARARQDGPAPAAETSAGLSRVLDRGSRACGRPGVRQRHQPAGPARRGRLEPTTRPTSSPSVPTGRHRRARPGRRGRGRRPSSSRRPVPRPRDVGRRAGRGDGGAPTRPGGAGRLHAPGRPDLPRPVPEPGHQHPPRAVAGVSGHARTARRARARRQGHRLHDLRRRRRRRHRTDRGAGGGRRCTTTTTRRPCTNASRSASAPCWCSTVADLVTRPYRIEGRKVVRT